MKLSGQKYGLTHIALSSDLLLFFILKYDIKISSKLYYFDITMIIIFITKF